MTNRFVLIFLLIPVFLQTSSAQERLVIKNAQIGLAEHASSSDSIIQSLIRIADDSLTIDSIKVEIVHFLGKTACDLCITYLIEHINDQFDYGDGISEIDQANLNACWVALGSIAHNKVKKWKLLTPIFNALRYKQQKDQFIRSLSEIFEFISDKKTAESILQFELKQSAEYSVNRIYKNNLLLMLEAINK